MVVNERFMWFRKVNMLEYNLFHSYKNRLVYMSLGSKGRTKGESSIEAPVYFANCFSIERCGGHYLLSLGYKFPNGVLVWYQRFAIDSERLKELLEQIGQIGITEEGVEVSKEVKPKPVKAVASAVPEREEVQGKVCPNCGWTNKPTARFCVKCGTRLG